MSASNQNGIEKKVSRGKKRRFIFRSVSLIFAVIFIAESLLEQGEGISFLPDQVAAVGLMAVIILLIVGMFEARIAARGQSREIVLFRDRIELWQRYRYKSTIKELNGLIDSKRTIPIALPSILRIEINQDMFESSMARCSLVIYVDDGRSTAQVYEIGGLRKEKAQHARDSILAQKEIGISNGESDTSEPIAHFAQAQNNWFTEQMEEVNKPQSIWETLRFILYIMIGVAVTLPLLIFIFLS